MIAQLEWAFAADATQWWARMDDRRVLRIGWDQTDSSFYLHVTVEPPPNVEAGAQRQYQAPIPLLAAALLLPPEEHERLVDTVHVAMVEQRDRVLLGNLHDVLDLTMQPWPKPSVAAQKMALAAEAMPQIERLALDIAAVGAFRAAA